MDQSDEILIVEDSSLQAKRLKRLLEKQGYKAVLAGNGREGLSMARERRPLLIVSDIIMPVMDGYEMCRILKRDQQLKDIPVILLTSLTDPRDVFLGLQSGADSYVSKPYNVESLLSRIENVLQNAQIEEREEVGEELEVFLGKQCYSINSSRRQILNLLLSTYQDAVEQNRKLREVTGQAGRCQRETGETPGGSNRGPWTCHLRSQTHGDGPRIRTGALNGDAAFSY